MKKLKAVTFSYDDGVEQDKRLIQLLDRYGLKCTFNLNSGHLGMKGSIVRNIFGATNTVSYNKIPIDEIKQVYINHEVASHTVNHPTLRDLTDDKIVAEVLEDAAALEKITGKKVCGLAYPNGYGPADPVVFKKLTGQEYVPSEGDKLFLKNEHRVSDLIRKNTELYYGRTTKSTYSFDLQENLLEFNPTVAHRETEERMDLAKRFVELEADKPQIYYIWGHSYEFDVSEKAWEDFERLCEFIAGHDNVFYGTNNEVFKHFGLK